MNSLSNLSPQQLRRAADLQERILALQNEFNRLVGDPNQARAVAPAATGKRKLSAQARARISAAAKKRWAAARAARGGAAARRAKSKISAAGRKRLAAAVKARWAAAKAAGRKAL
jgi:hypothetical protein